MGILSAFPGKSKPKLQIKTVSPSTSSQDVTADSEYDGLEKVTINAMRLQSKSVTPTTSAQTVRPDSGYNGISQMTVNRIPSSYVQPSSTRSAKTWVPGTSDQYIDSGTYCSGRQTIQGDANLDEKNIRSGETIFGITGACPKGFMMNAKSTTLDIIEFTHSAIDSLPDAILIAVTSEVASNGIQCAALVRTGSTYSASVIGNNNKYSATVSPTLSGNKLKLEFNTGVFYSGQNCVVTCLWED